MFFLFICDIRTNHYTQFLCVYSLNCFLHNLPALASYEYDTNPSGVCILLASLALSELLLTFSTTHYMLHSWIFVVIVVLRYYFPDSFCSPRILFLVLLHSLLWSFPTIKMTIIHEITIHLGPHGHKVFHYSPPNWLFINSITFLFFSYR